MSAALTVRLDENVLTRLDAVARERGVGRDALVEAALEEHLGVLGAGPMDFEAWQLAMVDEGLAAADRGDFASSDEVEAIFAKHRG